MSVVANEPLPISSLARLFENICFKVLPSVLLISINKVTFSGTAFLGFFLLTYLILGLYWGVINPNAPPDSAPGRPLQLGPAARADRTRRPRKLTTFLFARLWFHELTYGKRPPKSPRHPPASRTEVERRPRLRLVNLPRHAHRA